VRPFLDFDVDALSLFALAVPSGLALGVGVAFFSESVRHIIMRQPIPVTAEMLAREFREQRCAGSAVDAITNPLIRLCLEAGARARAVREGSKPLERRQYRDGKMRAAGDND
jgi:hypothetical protein